MEINFSEAYGTVYTSGGFPGAVTAFAGEAFQEPESQQ
jgi:hypothetical protein